MWRSVPSPRRPPAAGAAEQEARHEGRRVHARGPDGARRRPRGRAHGRPSSRPGTRMTDPGGAGFSQERLATYDDVTTDDLADSRGDAVVCGERERLRAAPHAGIDSQFHAPGQRPGTIPAPSRTPQKISSSYENIRTLWGVSPNKIMAELFAKDGGMCRGTGGSMHIFDAETHSNRLALVAAQFPPRRGCGRSIMLDRHLGLALEDDDRLAIVFAARVVRKMAGWPRS